MLSMELQLGLAVPPVHQSSPMIKGLIDLNDHHQGFDPNEVVVSGSGLGSDTTHFSKTKRSFEEACGNDHKVEAHHFLVWDGQPNEDDDRKGHKKRGSYHFNKIEGIDEESYVVGWPPIKSSRKKELLIQNHNINGGRGDQMKKRPMAKKINYNINDHKSSSISSAIISNYNSTYVKVKMEGVAIGRKIDLRLHHSYHTLKKSLITMFTNYDQKCMEESESYTLTYQDKEGDWLLVGDVPWQSFIKSVQRLEIARNGS